MRARRPKATFDSRTSALAAIAATLLLVALTQGCCGRLRNGSAERIFPQRTQEADSSEEERATTELILNVEDRVEQIALAPNSKRMIVETRLDDMSEGGLLDQDARSLVAEIWNVEFAAARPEPFAPTLPYLPTSALGAVAFDEKGDRIFWVGKEARDLTVAANPFDAESRVVRGAPTDVYPIGKRAPSGYLAGATPRAIRKDAPTLLLDEELSADPAPSAQATEPVLLLEDELVDSFPTNSKTPSLSMPARPATRTRENIENVIMTKRLETTSFAATENNNELDVKHVKLADETKTAISARLSPNAQWIICRCDGRTVPYRLLTLAEKTPNADATSDENAQTAEDATEDAEKDAPKENVVEPFDPNWALALVRDRRRVVRFPETVKMTFDSSTSDEEIFGRIVDVLDVSDKEDLVATLVEEIIPTGSARGGDANLNPRYKIVVWDLNVAKTVDLDKAKKPLRAIEISQIATPSAVERRFCKFSPSGKTIAARIEPKYLAVWQSVSGRPIVELGEHKNPIQTFAYAPGETKMIVGTGGANARLVLWEIRKGVVYRTLDDATPGAKTIDAATFSNDEASVYFANNVGEIKRWNIRATRDPR